MAAKYTKGTTQTQTHVLWNQHWQQHENTNGKLIRMLLKPK
jgi:hypothetical protein